MQKKYFLSAVGLFLVFLCIYYIGSFSRVPFADSVYYAFLVEEGFMQKTTATSHFLYINTAVIISKITGLNSIESNRILIITSASLTISIVYLIIRNLINNNWISILTAVIFGFSFTFWKNTEIIEVYTYNTLWIVLLFFCFVKTFQKQESKYIILSGLFLGISLWVHIQNILLLPALLVYFYYFKAEKRSVLLSLFSFIVLLSLLFVVTYFNGLPIKSIYTSGETTGVKDTFTKNFLQYLQDFAKSILYLIYNFNLFVIFGVVGAIKLFREERKMFYVFFTAAFLVYGFSTFYNVSDNYVFFLPFNIIFALSIGYGMAGLKFPFVKKISLLCFLTPLFYFASYKIILSTNKGTEFHNFKSYKGGLDYYMLPWMVDNAGILEFTIDKKQASEPIGWMTYSAKLYIEKLKKKGYTPEQIRKL